MKKHTIQFHAGPLDGCEVELHADFMPDMTLTFDDKIGHRHEYGYCGERGCSSEHAYHSYIAKCMDRHRMIEAGGINNSGMYEWHEEGKVQ